MQASPRGPVEPYFPRCPRQPAHRTGRLAGDQHHAEVADRCAERRGAALKNGHAQAASGERMRVRQTKNARADDNYIGSMRGVAKVHGHPYICLARTTIRAASSIESKRRIESQDQSTY